VVVGGQPAFWPRTDFVDGPTGLRDIEIKQVRRAFGEAIIQKLREFEHCFAMNRLTWRDKR
jgi:hypothetical protein